ncbi:phosphate ABC transporter permease subunit PstC [Aquamicrobium defluvii]|uniref:Phosphate transport system permease protein n=1 Tax=Aquamicrobium defluvii TaxID=69279 RepID=A0A011TRE6_9HYPH|nr:phosphate ABC transporter permease subunit PstC [Aquamicrobium defluvii]EXL06657.1 phosphate ABC transporter permease [Aquamicrobium defluvii]EZQ14480.1 phosphate ABC transporter permease [Halopseudomonas bauzanensis]TDR36715.1 phosphate ABC transporter membrane protein 1 (PhoT family) [Aquamicrobium defluvii]
MSVSWVLAIILVIGVVAFMVARLRAARLEPQAGVKQHSLPGYHGSYALILAIFPAIIFFGIWKATSPVYIDSAVWRSLPEQVRSASDANRSLTMGTIYTIGDGMRRLTPAELDQVRSGQADLKALFASRGVALASSGEAYMIPAAENYRSMSDSSSLWSAVGAILLSLAGAWLGLSGITLRRRARNNVERVMLWGLIAASTVAILTTVGIVLSMLFQTLTFFQSVPLSNFFFGTVWDPRFAAAGSGGATGQFGLIPLLAGTLYIALVAMLFAVPVGLFAAIYMSEYASRKVRSVVKPVLELLAGIPTIVYGIFALVTVGPLLRDISAALSGGQPFIMAQSVLTAGLVMGIMLIPFVSSLSDDIISSVPRSLHDGSLGLGATRSETVRNVILPAALPGIVGALLLTASRAIGETMIVVLAAGVAAKLTLNPGEAMTTITVKIVNQLTGDLEFTSPQTLVAFALGITLFVITLGMNVLALYIVRKYREQYE